MRQILKDLMLVVLFVLMFAAVPFALSPDNPLRQPPQPQAVPDVNVTVSASWVAILLVALGAPVLIALAGTADHSSTATHAAKRMEEHHHD